MRSHISYDPPYDDAYVEFVSGLKRPDAAQRLNSLTDRSTDATLLTDLRSYNQSLGATTATLASIDALQRGAKVVIAGQQPAAGGGPLYTLYKAITCIWLAQRLSEQHGETFVPVFWVHADDHDFYEASTARFIDNQGTVRSFTIPRPPALIPVGDLKLDFAPALAAWLQKVTGLSSDLAHSGPATDLGQWQSHLLLRLLSSKGLVCFDPRLRSARQLASLLLKEVASRGAWSDLVPHQTALELEPEHSCFFWHGDGGREAMLWEKDSIVTRSGSVRLSKDKLLTMIEESPGLFSPGVALRPVVQDTLFPVAMSVCGPGEFSYMPSAIALADSLQRELAPLWPRLSAVIVNRDIAAYVQEIVVCPGKIRHYVQVRDSYLGPRGASDIDRLFIQHKDKVKAAYDDLLPYLIDISCHLESIAAENGDRVSGQIDYLEKKAKQHHAKKYRQELNRLQALWEQLWPGGKPQERICSIMGTIVACGPELITMLLNAPANGKLHVISLSKEA